MLLPWQWPLALAVVSLAGTNQSFFSLWCCIIWPLHLYNSCVVQIEVVGKRMPIVLLAIFCLHLGDKLLPVVLTSPNWKCAIWSCIVFLFLHPKIVVHSLHLLFVWINGQFHYLTNFIAGAWTIKKVSIFALSSQSPYVFVTGFQLNAGNKLCGLRCLHILT